MAAILLTHRLCACSAALERRLPHDLRGDSCDEGSIWSIRRHHCPGADDYVVTETDASENNRSRTDETAFPDAYVAARGRHLGAWRIVPKASSHTIVKTVDPREDVTAMRKERVIAYINVARNDIESGVHDRTTLTYMQALHSSMDIRIVYILKAAKQTQLSKWQQGES